MIAAVEAIEAIDAIEAIEAIDAIDAIVAIDYIEAVGFWGCGLGGMEEIKKSGGGDVRAEALAWDDEWDKA